VGREKVWWSVFMDMYNKEKNKERKFDDSITASWEDSAAAA